MDKILIYLNTYKQIQINPTIVTVKVAEWCLYLQENQPQLCLATVNDQNVAQEGQERTMMLDGLSSTGYEIRS